ncbi:MAG: DUF47 domain-containing protein [Planctomycetes bacterium]|nr:DUF47 domain-containing protein [Planctomycetota bacterium]
MFGLIPKEESFFELFEAAAKNVHEASLQFLEFLKEFNDLNERAKRIKDLEHAGDQITHETINRLNRTFITPLDREDVHELICRLDDIVDLIDTSVSRMVLYKIKEPTQDALALAECLRHATAILVEAVTLLRDMRNAKEILKRCVDVHTQENEGDRIEQHALASLFENHHDPVFIIKWKDVYQEIEAATDRCEDVANVLEGIVLKNA